MKAIIFSVCVLLQSLSGHAQSLGDNIDNMLWVQGTPEPKVIASATRTGVQFGNVRIRSAQQAFNLYNFSTPRFSTGCGSLDFYGGGFSFLNADEFRSILRQIGQNAMGYAFALSLQNMCEACWNTLQDMHGLVSKLNMGQLDTCLVAQKLVNPESWKQVGDGISKKWNAVKAESGSLSDNFTESEQVFKNPFGWLTDPSTKTEADGTKTIANVKGEDVPVIEFGNQVWNIIQMKGRINQQMNVTTISDEDFSAAELAMSLIGTTVMMSDETDANGQKGKVVFFAPLITYEQFIRGAKSGESVHFVVCSTGGGVKVNSTKSATKCDSARHHEQTDWKGISKFVGEKMDLGFDALLNGDWSNPDINYLNIMGIGEAALIAREANANDPVHIGARQNIVAALKWFSTKYVGLLFTQKLLYTAKMQIMMTRKEYGTDYGATGKDGEDVIKNLDLVLEQIDTELEDSRVYEQKLVVINLIQSELRKVRLGSKNQNTGGLN